MLSPQASVLLNQSQWSSIEPSRLLALEWSPSFLYIHLKESCEEIWILDPRSHSCRRTYIRSPPLWAMSKIYVQVYSIQWRNDEDNLEISAFLLGITKYWHPNSHVPLRNYCSFRSIAGNRRLARYSSSDGLDIARAANMFDSRTCWWTRTFLSTNYLSFDDSPCSYGFNLLGWIAVTYPTSMLVGPRVRKRRRRWRH